MKFLQTSIFVVILLLVLPPRARATPDDVASIQSAIRSQHYDEALSIADSALKTNPRDFRVWTLQGIALSLKGETSAALGAFQNAIALSPDYPPALQGEAQILYQTGDERAIGVLQKISKANPGDQTAHEMLAVVQAKHENCSAALSQFQLIDRTVEFRPESLEWYGYCLMRGKQFAEAATMFERLVKLLPEKPYARYDLALMQTLSNRNGDAIQTLQPLLAAQTVDPDVLSLASQAYEALGDTPNAVSNLRRAILLQPDNADLYVQFGGLCLSHDSFEVGLDMINAGIKRIPNNASLYIVRGLLYGQLADYDKADRDFETAEQLNPAEVTGSYALALTKIQAGHAQEALAEIQKRLIDHPHDASLHYVLAKILVEQGAKVGSAPFRQAMESALLAVRLKPDLTAARDLLASMYLKSGQNTLAIEQCRRALQTDPANQSALYHLIMASHNSGQKADINALEQRLLLLQSGAGGQQENRTRYKFVEPDHAAQTK
jgi:tetratricopeptide (TPR) repeat protein